VVARPFEKRVVDYDRLVQIGIDLLEAIGETPDRDGLKETPERFARMWKDFIEYEPGTLDTSFPTTSSNSLVGVGPIRVWSKCEHHTVDFWTDIWMAAVPGARILGLSKFARIAFKHAHRLQVQEHLVSDIADELADLLGNDDVAVLGRGSHLCMVARGIRAEGLMTNYALRGVFQNQPLRQEFLSRAT
jgi:GTP cyclohydrolase I